MNYINLKGELINLENVNRIRRVQPGEQEMIEFQSVNIDSHEIRLYTVYERYLSISYGSDSETWRNDWDQIVSLTTNDVESTKQSPERGDTQ